MATEPSCEDQIKSIGFFFFLMKSVNAKSFYNQGVSEAIPWWGWVSKNIPFF